LGTIINRKNVTVVETALSTWHSDFEFDYCIHAASPASPTQYLDAEAVSQANVGFLTSLSKGRIPSVLLFLSSGEIYGPKAPLGISENFEGEPAPKSLRSIYAEAKKMAEFEVMQLGQEGRTKAIVVRLFHSYGPGVGLKDGRSFADFLWSGALGKDITLRSDGSDVRTFLYLEDSIAGILLCLTGGRAQEVYNVGSEIPYKVADFADAVGRLSGVGVIKPPSRASQGPPYINSPNKFLVPSNSKLQSLGWSQQVPLEEGILRSIRWIRKSEASSGGD
jgi:dTDP-glucose 4,6-dehydratase